MDYQDQVNIGNLFNIAITEALQTSFEPNELPAIVSAVAQALLIKIDQGGYKIEKK